ncbi:unnamed protein product [Durusdinium trenchii]|uniref:Uncharacterized protein n=1 Tax=Durusdinium trenchii TaxID=1381693 RepID=A0ABP0HJW9_9DINO
MQRSTGTTKPIDGVGAETGLDTMAEDVDQLKFDVGELKDLLTNSKGEVNHIRRIVLACERDMEDFTAAMDAVNVDLDEMRARVDATHSIITSRQRVEATMTAEISTMRLDIGDIQEALKNHDSWMEDVSNTLQQMQEKEDNTTEDLINLKNEFNTKLDGKVDNVAWKEANDDLDAAVKTVRDMVSSLRLDVDARRRKVDEILSTMRHDVTSVETNLEESKSKLATDTDHAINALNGRIDFTNKDLSATQESLHTTQNSLSDCFNEVAVVRSDLERSIADTEARAKNDTRQKQQETLEKIGDVEAWGELRAAEASRRLGALDLRMSGVQGGLGEQKRDILKLREEVNGLTVKSASHEVDISKCGDSFKKMEKQRNLDAQNIKAQLDAIHDVLDTKVNEKPFEDVKHCVSSLTKGVVKFAQVVGVFPGPRFDDAEGAESGEADVELLGWEETNRDLGGKMETGQIADHSVLRLLQISQQHIESQLVPRQEQRHAAQKLIPYFFALCVGAGCAAFGRADSVPNPICISSVQMHCFLWLDVSSQAVDVLWQIDVVVLEGRHFQDFAAGDSGVVNQVDCNAKTCQVHFKHRPGERLCVAWRHLCKCEAKEPRPEAREELRSVDRPKHKVAEDVDDALGTSALEVWESKLAHIDHDSLDVWRLCRSGADIDAQGDLTEALEASAIAKVSSSLAAVREAKAASLRVKEFDEKINNYSREHWLSLDCLQEKVNSMAMGQKELSAEFKGSLQKELASVNLQVQSLYEQCEAIKDMVTQLRKELGQKASHEQLEDLEHQQCKAMESLLRRWDHCAESRCKAVESQVVKLVDEVHEPERRQQAQVGASCFQELVRKVDRLQAHLAELSRASNTDHSKRLEELSAEQARMRQHLQKKAEQPGLEDRINSDRQHLSGLAAKVDALQSQVEALCSGLQAAEAKASKEQAILDGLRLRADAAAEGLASEVRLREEGLLRLEAQLQNLSRDTEAAMEALRGGVEKQLNAMLTTAQSTAERKQRDWQQECQRRQDAESALKEHQLEMAEMRSKLLRKEQALLEATGFSSNSREDAHTAPSGLRLTHRSNGFESLGRGLSRKDLVNH